MGLKNTDENWIIWQNNLGFNIATLKDKPNDV